MIIDIATYGSDSPFPLAIYPRESRRKQSQWILWIAEDGSGDLYVGRDKNGGVTGEPIHLPASITRATRRISAEEMAEGEAAGTILVNRDDDRDDPGSSV